MSNIYTLKKVRPPVAEYGLPHLTFGVVFGLVFSVGATIPITGQTTSQDMRPGMSAATQSHQQVVSPVPDSGVPSVIVTAGSLPPRTLEWANYLVVEACHVALARTLKQISVPLVRDTLRDTVRHMTPWTPLPPTAMDFARQCLPRFPVATVPPAALPMTLELAVALNADSLVPPIVAQELARVSGHDPRAQGTRAAILDTAISVLVNNPWDMLAGTGHHFTTAHLALARTYLASQDSLGTSTSVLYHRTQARLAFVGQAEEIRDLDAQLTLRQDIHQLLVAFPPPPPVLDLDHPGDAYLLQVWKLNNEIRLRELIYLHSFTHPDLTDVLKAQQVQWNELARMQQGQAHNVFASTVVTTTPRPLACTYWFQTPPGTSKPLPTPSLISVVVMEGLSSAPLSEDLLKEVRRLSGAAIPGVELTVVTQTTGTAGNQLFVDHPEREAQLRAHYLSDSVQVPGRVCVIGNALQRLENGHTVVNATDLKAYYDASVTIFDPTGMIAWSGNPSVNNGPYGTDVVDFVRRMRNKFPASGH